MRLYIKDKRKSVRNTQKVAPGRPNDQAVYTCRSIASTARAVRTTCTKRQRRRNEADLPVIGGGQVGLTPLNSDLIIVD